MGGSRGGPVGRRFREIQKRNRAHGNHPADSLRQDFGGDQVAISNGSSSHPFSAWPLAVAVEREVEVLQNLIGNLG